MNKLTEENYLQIQGWMRTLLDLKGNELLVYALIYGFSQDGESEFNGSRSYIAEWIGASLPTVDKSLSGLIEKGYIIKTSETINGVTFNRYKTDLQVVKKLYRGSKKTLQGGSKETLHNNNILNNNINNNIKENNTKESKHKHGEYGNVLLTDTQVEKLNIDYGEQATKQAIKFLDEWIQEKGYKSKEHNLAMRRWVFDAIKKQPKQQSNMMRGVTIL